MTTAGGVPAVRKDLVVQPGATLKFSTTVRDAAGNAIDNTGALDAEVDFRAKARFPVELLSVSAAGGNITFGGVSGLVSIELTPANTALLTENTVYDVLLTYADGSIDKILFGDAVLRRAVTT